MSTLPQTRRNPAVSDRAASTTPIASRESIATRCQRCRRPLRASLSVLRCLGPVCHLLDRQAVIR